MVHCKNWDRQLMKFQVAKAKKRNRPARCRSRVVKTMESMEKRT